MYLFSITTAINTDHDIIDVPWSLDIYHHDITTNSTFSSSTNSQTMQISADHPMFNKDPPNVRRSLLTQNERREVRNHLNFQRSQIARYGINGSHTASNMNLLFWDNAAEIVAQQHTDQCLYDPINDLPTKYINSHTSFYATHPAESFDLGPIISVASLRYIDPTNNGTGPGYLQNMIDLFYQYVDQYEYAAYDQSAGLQTDGFVWLNWAKMRYFACSMTVCGPPSVTDNWPSHPWYDDGGILMNCILYRPFENGQFPWIDGNDQVCNHCDSDKTECNDGLCGNCMTSDWYWNGASSTKKGDRCTNLGDDYNPTPQPTQSPTEYTANPTSMPSKHPTMAPTMQSTTLNPTKYPSKYPTLIPTYYPSDFPSYIPSLFPTYKPTLNPSFFPTTIPTLFPSNNPSKDPSNALSTSFSSAPTKYPTNIPTLSPSKNPTKFPIDVPTQFPSEYPTKYPSNIPTLIPSHIPTISQTISDKNTKTPQDVGFIDNDNMDHLDLTLITILSFSLAACCCCLCFILILFWIYHNKQSKQNIVNMTEMQRNNDQNNASPVSGVNVMGTQNNADIVFNDIEKKENDDNEKAIDSVKIQGADTTNNKALDTFGCNHNDNQMIISSSTQQRPSMLDKLV